MTIYMFRINTRTPLMNQCIEIKRKYKLLETPPLNIDRSKQRLKVKTSMMEYCSPVLTRALLVPCFLHLLC